MDYEEPHSLLYIFYELCGTFGMIETDEEALLLRVFSFSLIGKAKAWLQSQPNQSLTSWKDVKARFLSKFFPPSKNTKAKEAICDKPLCEA